jgi:hypothetical protein
MQDITHGTKHRTIGKYSPSVKKAEEHRGAFSSAFSKAFDVSRLQLTLTDESIIYFDEEVTKVRNYWHTYFTDTLKERV